MKSKFNGLVEKFSNLYQDFRKWSLGKKENTLMYMVLVFTLGFVGSNQSVCAEEIFVLNSTSQLVRVETTNLAAPVSTVTVTGITVGETLSDLDFRPVNGTLVGMGTLGNVYAINAITGAAIKVNSAPIGVTPSGTTFSIDFNPVVDRIRFVSNTGQNLRLNPENGVVAGTDTNLAFAQGDPNSSKTPGIIGNAYSDDFTGTTATTLYAIDATNNLLLRQGSLDGSPVSPNTGTLFTVGSLGETISGGAAFDISAETGLAYAAFLRTGKTVPELFTVSLGTGKLTLLGDLPISGTVRGIAIPTLPAKFVSLAFDAGLSIINVDAPSQQFKTKSVTGLQPSETILAVDYRPASDELFALGSQSRIYKLNIETGAATAVGTGFTPLLSGAEFGFDFNPTVDRIRVVSDTGANFRIDPTTGAVVASDTSLAYAAGDANSGSSGKGVGLAYTDAVFGGTTTAYLVDSQIGILTTLGGLLGAPSPNTGQLFTVGALPAAVSTDTGFDITPGGKTGYLNLATTLYEVDPTTGKGFSRGTTPANRDIAALPVATFNFSSATGTIAEAASSATLTVVRTRNLMGTAYVPYKTVSGTATGGSDFTETFGVLTFVDGESTKTIPLTVANDSSAEPSENFSVQLLQPYGGVLGTVSTSTIGIVDSIDSDADGFSNAIEALARTDANNAASNPVGAPGAVVPRSISTARVALTFDLTRTGRDSLTYTGRVTTSSSFNPSGKTMLLEVAGFARKFKFNSRLTATNGSATIRLNKIRGGYGFSLSIPRVDLLAVLEDQGITRSTPDKTNFVVPTAVVFDQRLSTKAISLSYSVAKPVRATARN